MNYKMILQYEGTRYNGWQRQGNTDQTIQGKLETLLGRLTGEAVEVQGSGRTDAGVHAKGQTANFHLKGEWKPKTLMEELNRYLPADIGVLELELAPERFHSRLNAVGKLYRYQIWMEGKADVFSHRFFYSLGKELDRKAMEEAAKLLIGERDFKSFCGNRNIKKSTVRQLRQIEIRPIWKGRALEIDYEGNGFLQQMVRILTGTLIEVGLGKRSAGEMTEILEAKSRPAAGFTAPAQGLCLMRVMYDTDSKAEGIPQQHKRYG